MTIGNATQPDRSRHRAASDGLLIRAARSDDLEALTTLVNLPGFRAGTLRLPYQRSEVTRRWLEDPNTDGLNIVAFRDGELVGQAGFERYRGRRAHVAYIGIGVHDEHHGTGIGTALLGELVDAADNWFGLKRLELTVYSDNAVAIALYRKFGFEPEGLLRAYAFRAGAYADALTMARLRS
ncbi:GNAT family acetyltransferase [Bosea sp. 62]|uniref:GNAT family N-acetyltransferase n=1 Tax=unclassified Bosea (in: a-proteobacteria) TaxID=2653178 RepID=UPI001257E9BA|nr:MULTISPECIES: GNAT family N-acetyltransferase [unclassified Bosea (in: a-proteobacteria)]CAD5256229.1 GNAT family acetyltransferase [Bosea sp. 46]CAD5260275.1 GNAT family acetyltransferase [Bosea sp. 21B]CAD5280378.1 GNAT family acetyltransferase [Bosea sp. 7B]VVT58227.1 GNAT family acetyltransferase [Bosea sp. EC-HK365B]VXB49274.1 GNAT family acetyltransferase [Bosea sp. 29B]